MPRFICLNCFHQWDSHPYNNNRVVLRCSVCHRRQGVNYDKFLSAMQAAKSALRKISDSPPPKRPPIEVKDDIPAALDPVFEIARKEFPSPVVALNFLKEIMRNAIKELRSESSQDIQVVTSSQNEIKRPIDSYPIES